jgi:outer membrane autotransporter protein
MDRVNLGIMGEIDWMSEDGDDEGRVDGTGWMIGPYLSAEISDGLFLDMRAMRGQTDNSIRQEILGIDYSGDFTTDRWLAEATLTGNYDLNPVTVTPDIRFLYIREDQEDYTVSCVCKTVSVDGQTVELSQLSGGLRISRMIETDGMMFRPYAAGRLFWNIDNPGELTVDGEYVSTDDVRGAVTLGLDAGSDAMQFGIEGTYDGLFGDGDHAIGGRVSFGYRF